MRLIILGATGSLGAHVLAHALGAGHDVSVLLRDPSRLPAEARQRIVVHTGDLGTALPPDLVRGHDALINCAGNVADGERFVSPLIASLRAWNPCRRASGPSPGSWQEPRCSISMLRVAAASSCPR